MSITKDSNYCSGRDVLLLPDGSVYHLGIKKGDVSNRIITVGCHRRADLIGTLLDQTPTHPTSKTSSRLFKVINGAYRGVGITIIAIGMGAPMVDFLMREVTYVNPGSLAVVRIGTCGLNNKDDMPGNVIVAEASSYAYRNYAYFDGCVNDPKQDGKQPGVFPYLITKPVLADPQLSAKIMSNMKTMGLACSKGLNMSGETFYSCQGRKDSSFEDQNESLLKQFEDLNVRSIELETHQLFHLAKMRKGNEGSCCKAAGCAIGIVNRVSPTLDQSISQEQLEGVERNAARAVMDALIEIELP